MLRQLHFLHIGKTGGTALIHALSSCQNNQWRLVSHGHNVKLEEIPVSQPVIFTLRDPVQRFISGFNSRRRQGRPRYHYPWSQAEAAAFSTFASANDLANALSSPHDQTRAQAVAAMQSIQHVRSHYQFWLNSVEYLESRSQDVLWIGRTEHLTADFETLKQLLNLPAECALPASDVLSHRRLETDDTWLDAVGLQNIKQWYHSDSVMLESIFCRFTRSFPA